MKSPNEYMPMKVPENVAVCPICSAPIVIEEVQDWREFRGKIVIDPTITTVSVTCTTEPDIDSEEWGDWMDGHFAMPYADWLPVQQKVTRWLAYNVPTNWNQPA